MTPTTHTTHTAPTTIAPRRADPTPVATLSPARLNVLRVGYLIVGVGLAVVKWPELLHHDRWALMEGVVNCMLVAVSALALLGLRYPRQMVPVLLFESAWKLIWLSVVAVPLWTGHRMDPATAEVVKDCLLIVIILAVIPWRYVYTQFVAQPADPWRTN